MNNEAPLSAQSRNQNNTTNHYLVGDLEEAQLRECYKLRTSTGTTPVSMRGQWDSQKRYL